MALLRLVVAVVAVMVVAPSLTPVEAFPRYILVPLEDVTLMEPNTPPAHARYARSLRRPSFASARSDQNLQYAEPLPLGPVQPVARENRDRDPLLSQASDSYHSHSGGYAQNDHVDYGAYTGGYGAFGWYSDHPVCLNCGHYH